jgi:hypothetical protein
MRLARALTAIGIAAALSSPALAADATTVQALLAQGYELVGTIPSQIGPGLFLQLGESLYLCFVSESPNSPDLKTHYCKPVH